MDKRHLFQQRWTQQWRLFSKYLRYVFNDHAVLALFFLLGAAGLAYRNLWQHAPITLGTKALLLIILVITLVIFKTPANFLKPADPVFLMGDETALRRLFRTATRYSAVINGVMQFIMTLLLWPMMFRLLTPYLSVVILVTLVLVITKIILTITAAKRIAMYRQAEAGDMIDWRALIANEEKRQNSILAFFNLFIDVPGQRPSIKRHRWADRFIHNWPGHRQNPLVKLMVTTFVRQSQFAGVWVRLTAIGIVAGLVTTGWLQTALYAILMYLIVLQVLPLVASHQQLVFDHLFPVTIGQRQQAFRFAITPWLVLTIMIWSLVGFATTPSVTLLLQNVIGLVVVGGILVFWYTNRRIANTFRRRNSRAFTK